MSQQDFRARLSPKTALAARDILGTNDVGNILFPLFSTNGVLFPYTPTISTGSEVNYDKSTFTHSNYGYSAYINSTPKTITILAEFTAQTTDEALYLLAVLHFFRSVTKSYFGVNPYNKAGTPPPVLLFNYLGDYQFNNVPVLIKSFDYSLPGTIDYVAVSTSTVGSSAVDTRRINLPKSASGGYTYVPTHLAVTLELDTQYIPLDLRNNFNLDLFREGKLMNKGYI
jgi:hypothetical protein